MPIRFLFHVFRHLCFTFSYLKTESLFRLSFRLTLWLNSSSASEMMWAADAEFMNSELTLSVCERSRLKSKNIPCVNIFAKMIWILICNTFAKKCWHKRRWCKIRLLRMNVLLISHPSLSKPFQDCIYVARKRTDALLNKNKYVSIQ